MFLGIEIGGTKLQLGLGAGDGVITALWRGTVNPAAGSEGIRKQIESAVPELLAKANLDRGELRGVGIGFGGPTDDASQTVIKSHQIAGWDGFPLRDWISDLLGGVPAVLCNDADVAGLAEALFGAGKGLSPIFYITVGTGVGGGLIIDGQIYRGVGRGAAEIGHTHVTTTSPDGMAEETTLEAVASGWGIASQARRHLVYSDEWQTGLRKSRPEEITAVVIANEARAGNEYAHHILELAHWGLQQAIRQVIVLLCPRRVVIGGGVSLMGEDLLFEPVRRRVAGQAFEPFRGLTDIVPAVLGEEVVVHGALALARQKLRG
jgi:glucokinase